MEEQGLDGDRHRDKEDGHWCESACRVLCRMSRCALPAHLFGRRPVITLYPTTVHSILSALGIHRVHDPEALWEHMSGGLSRRTWGTNGAEVRKE